MKTITIANQKGGVGKSAVARLLAHYLVRIGRRVLTVDLDHQANLSEPLKLSQRAEVASCTASHLFSGESVTLPEEASLVLVPADAEGLLGLERQPDRHNDFATAFRGFLRSQVGRFDACIIDTNPNPDIRLVCALVSSNYVLSPIQLNQEAIAGIVGLVNHPRVGIQRFKKQLNPALELLGILPTLVEPTPFQKDNFAQLSAQYAHLLIRHSDGNGFAAIPKRSVIAEAQATGALLWEMKKSSARETWREIEPTLRTLAARLSLSEATAHA